MGSPFSLQLVQAATPRAPTSSSETRGEGRGPASASTSPPDRQGVPVFMGGTRSNSRSAPLAVSPIIEEVPQIDPGLVEVGIHPGGSVGSVATAPHLVPQPVQGVPQRTLRPRRSRTGHHRSGRRHPGTRGRAPPDRGPRPMVSMSFQVPLNPSACTSSKREKRPIDLAEAKQGSHPAPPGHSSWGGIQGEGAFECVPGPRELLPGKAGVAQPHIQFHGIWIQSEALFSVSRAPS